MSRRRVLVAATDPITESMPGPAIRAWHLAEQLSAEHDVSLVSTVACDRRHPRMETAFADAAEMGRRLEWMEVALVPPGMLRHTPALRLGDKPLAVDIYDPFHLENLESGPSTGRSEHVATVAHLTAVLNEALCRGDWFCCASARQRDFWLGSLAALGRVNPYTYEGDTNLDGLVSVVPFGVPSDPPRRHGPGLRGVIPGVDEGDKIVLWGGGVYNWFDPLSLIRAVEAVKDELPTVRLVFLGMRHPNPAIPEMGVAHQARRLAADRGLTGKHVFFNETWLPYDSRANVLLDADVGVSTHLAHIETRFSFRTRVLDYLWAGLPTVLTGGDALADLVGSRGAGVVVAPGDAGAIARGLLNMLAHPPPRRHITALADGFRWERVAEPLLEFCRAPWRARDLVAQGGAPAAGGVGDGGNRPGSPLRAAARALRERARISR